MKKNIYRLGLRKNEDRVSLTKQGGGYDPLGAVRKGGEGLYIPIHGNMCWGTLERGKKFCDRGDKRINCYGERAFFLTKNDQKKGHWLEEIIAM